MFLHQTYIQAKLKQKKQKILTTTKCALRYLQLSEAPTPRDPLYKLKCNKCLGISLAWWAHNLLESIRDKIAQA